MRWNLETPTLEVGMQENVISLKVRLAIHLGSPAPYDFDMNSSSCLCMLGENTSY